METGVRRGEPFFFYFAATLFGIVILSFPLHALLNTADLPPLRPLLHIHALLMGGWFGLVLLQTALIRRGRVSLHRRLGLASLLLAAVMLPLDIFISYENMMRTDDSLIFKANSLNALAFIALYGSAILFRNKADAHKRLMMFAALSLMPPAFGRVMYVLHVSGFLALALWFAFVLAIIIYDLAAKKKLMAATLAGTALFFVQNALIIAAVAMTPGPAAAEDATVTMDDGSGG